LADAEEVAEVVPDLVGRNEKGSLTLCLLRADQSLMLLTES
jgi:hypothetical protein